MPDNHSVRYAAERLALRILGALIAAFLVIVVFPQVWRLFSPFLIALPIASLLQPSIRFLEEKLHLRRGLAVSLWVLLVCSVAFVLLYWFISFVVVQIVSAANNASSIVGSVVGVLQTATNRILNEAQAMPIAIGDTIRSSLDSAFQSLSSGGMALASGLVNLVVSVAARLPYAFVYTNFLVLGVFFLTNRYDSIRKFFGKLQENPAPPDAEEENSAESITMLRQSAIHGMVGYIRVQLLFFTLTFLLSWVYFQFLGFEYAMLIGVVAALLELIPQFGCGTLYIPWSILSFIIGSNQNGWLILGLYLGYCLLRRLTEPMLLGSNLGVSPLLSLVGMFVGMQVAGIPGLIAGPIVMVVLVSAVRAHLFRGVFADCQSVSRYLKARWKRGQKGVPYVKS